MNTTNDKIPVIASLSASGAGCREIGEAVDLHYTQVARILRRGEVKAIVQACESSLASRGMAKATENVIKVVERFDPDKPIDSEDKQGLALMDMGMRASLKIVEGMGLIPSNSMAPMIQQINVAGNAQIVSPLVDRALAQAMLVPDTTICSAEDD